MPVPTVPYRHTITLSTMLGAAEVYGWGYRGNGWPVPLKGESQTAYLARVLGGSWHPSSSDPITAGIEAVGGVAIDLGLDVVTPFAALVGQGSQVQAVKAVVDAGLSADERQALSHGTGPTVTYYPPPGNLQQLLAFASHPPAAASVAKAISKGNPMSSVRFTMHQRSPGTVASMRTALGIQAPPPTPANPTAGRTFLGIPVVDAAIGALALGGLAIVAKVEGYL